MWQEALFWILDKAVLAVFVGLVANGMFLCIISKFRPKIDISQQIAHRLDKDGKSIYRIKVINRTRYPIVDIKAQLHVFTSRQTATGEIWVSTSIDFKQSDPIMIDITRKIKIQTMRIVLLYTKILIAYGAMRIFNFYVSVSMLNILSLASEHLPAWTTD